MFAMACRIIVVFFILADSLLLCGCYVERVAIVLDLDCSTNSVDHAFAVLFPCK